MTVNELYSLTKSLMFEKPSSTTYDNYLVGNLNRLLVELYNENKKAAIFNGGTVYDSPQTIPTSDYNDVELELEDEYARNVLPLGLAARFFIDDDLNKYTLFNNDYLNARKIHQKMLSDEVLEDAAS